MGEAKRRGTSAERIAQALSGQRKCKTPTTGRMRAQHKRPAPGRLFMWRQGKPK